MDPQSIVLLENLDDPRLDPYRDLRTRNPTRYGGRFIVESEKLVDRLVASSLNVESILVDSTIQDVPAEWLLRSKNVFRVADASQLIGFNFHRGALACGERPAEVSALDYLQESLFDESCPFAAVYLHGVQDPENLGSIFRCCAALGIQHAILGPATADPLSRRVIRVSMGSVLKLRLLSDRRPLDLLRLLKLYNVYSIAATLQADATPLPRVRANNRWMLLVGNEADGLPAELVAACSHPTTIPMQLGVDSLNVAVAAGIFLFHLSNAST